MELEIKNYKCISEMNFKLNEDKLNFIYGISGSGKTSISEVMYNKLQDTNFARNCKKVDSDGEIDINLKKNSTNQLSIFNEESIKDYIFEKKSDGIYEIIYHPSDELLRLDNQIKEFKKNPKVKEIRDILIKFQYNFNQLNNQLDIVYTKTGKLSVTKAIKALKNEKSFEVHNKYNNSQISWLNKGINEFDITGTCPFCDMPLEQERIEYIESLNEAKPDAIKKIQENTSILESLKINQLTLNTKEESENLQEELGYLPIINSDVNELLKMLDNTYTDNDNIKPIQTSEITQKYFNDRFGIDISSALSELNQSKIDYLNLCNVYKGKYIQNLHKNISKLNKELRKLHVPYLFEKTSTFDKEEKYKLVHIKSKTKEDFSNELSTGEKNIIALALFLIVNSDNDVIIDDPASSFDEYKRSKIIKLINDTRKDNGKFTLVLSHDQIFLKFLLHDYDSNWDCYILESNVDNKLTVIDKADMTTLLNHIKRNLKKCKTYEQKILNLRMYYEINKSKSEYQYLSAIFHRKSKEEVLMELAEKKLSEEEILSKIKNDTSVELDKYDTCDFMKIYDDVSNFEKMFIKREELKGEEKKMFNDVVHFNYSLIHMIDPYKYNFQVKEIYDYL